MTKKTKKATGPTKMTFESWLLLVNEFTDDFDLGDADEDTEIDFDTFAQIVKASIG